MAQAVTISVEPRDPAKNKGTGTRAVRRLRSGGRVPAILYGHKQDNVPISLTREDVWSLIKSGHHVAQLKIGELIEMALIRAVQWDHLGKEIIHLDFARVSAHERVKTEVPLMLHGTPVGLAEGGTLEQPLHHIRVSCEVTAIPDSIRVEIAHLHLNDMLYVRDLVLPPGVEVEADLDQVLVHVAIKKVEAEPVVAAAPVEGAAGTEPEVIGRKEKKETEEEPPAKK